MTKIQRRRKSKEFGIKPKRISFGKKTKKIKCPNKKRVRRLIFNGKRNRSCRSLRQEMLRMKEKQTLPRKVGLREENSDMVGEKRNKRDQRATSSLKITKQRLSKRDSKLSSSKKPQKGRNQVEPPKEKERENRIEDDIF